MKSPFFKTIETLPPAFIAGFDSATGMVKALSNFLKGQDFQGAGVAPPSETLAETVNSLPRKIKEIIYTESGAFEALDPEKLGRVKTEEFAEWVTNSYPERPYQSIMVGSSGGASMHLAALLGMPWLPQTFLIPVQRPQEIGVDEPKRAMEWAKAPAEKLLRNNPQLQLHHMYDPSQDRLMLGKMTYFRVKKLKLGEDYERFISKNLAKGGTIFLNECTRKWPTVKVDDRHLFQFGALGGATEKEFYEGSDRVEEFLKRYGSPYTKWDAPEPDGDRPEAEWGLAESLKEDVMSFARQHGYKVVRMVHEEPEHPSPFVAELYRWWYGRRGLRSNRLVIESFVNHDPYLILATGSVPFWMKFNMLPSAEWVEAYLEKTKAYDEIYLMLFSHGVDAIGKAEPERWKSILQKARNRGEELGVDFQEYPRDFGTLVRYNTEFKRKIQSRYPIRQMELSDLLEYAKANEGKYKVKFQFENNPEASNADKEAPKESTGKKGPSPGRAQKQNAPRK